MHERFIEIVHALAQALVLGRKFVFSKQNLIDYIGMLVTEVIFYPGF